ncbi:MAG: hypothetical protein ABI389_06000 [Rhodanobacter sp.]
MHFLQVQQSCATWQREARGRIATVRFVNVTGSTHNAPNRLSVQVNQGRMQMMESS